VTNILGWIACIVGPFIAGWCAAIAWRQWVIATHTRCPVCDGSGCFNDITEEYRAVRTVMYDSAPPGSPGETATTDPKEAGAES
jgi:hypothetical protein